MNRVRRAGVTLALTSGLLLIFGSPFAAAARTPANHGSRPAVARGSHARRGLRIKDPFLLTRPHTRVQFMPTTQWVRRHPQYFTAASLRAVHYRGAVSGRIRRQAEGPLTSPSCTLAIDNSPGDAHVVVNNQTTQNDALDLSAFGLNSDATNITATIQVENLHDGSPAGSPEIPDVSGGGDIWYVSWDYGNVSGVEGYFLEAEYPGSSGNMSNGLPVDFEYGEIQTSATGGKQYTNEGTATGSLDPSTDTITITAPLSDVDSPPAGAALTNATAEGDALVGTSASGGLLENADTLVTTYNPYEVGDSQPSSNCPTAKTASSPTPGPPQAGDTGHNLTHYGGPVTHVDPTTHTVRDYLIFWLPANGTTGCPTTTGSESTGTYVGATYHYEAPYDTNGVSGVPAPPGGPVLPGASSGDGDTAYETILANFFHDIGGTSYFNLLSQYADQTTGITENGDELGGTWVDNCAYTSTPAAGTTTSTPAATAADPIYDTDIQAEVSRAISVNNWPVSTSAQYFVFTGYGATSCFNLTIGASPPTCNTSGIEPDYCAYHGIMQVGGTSSNQADQVLYANMSDGAFAANPSTVNLCYETPIGSEDPEHDVNGTEITDPIADAEVAITSHEHFEAMNDPQVTYAVNYGPPLGWYSGPNDQADGEIGDKCAYVYNNYAADGSNLNLHGDHYIVQTEYSNWDNGCALTAYQGNGGYGGQKDTATIEDGWNLLGIPASGVASTDALKTDMEATSNLPSGSVRAIGTFHAGRWTMTVSGYTPSQPIARTDGIFVLSGNAGTYTPSGTVYTSAPTISMAPGWNLVAATFPDPGVMTDSLFNEIEAENDACTASDITNDLACTPTVSAIDTYVGGSYLKWAPAPNSSNHPTWPQTFGNRVPFTNGMFIDVPAGSSVSSGSRRGQDAHRAVAVVSSGVTWTPQGTLCNSDDPDGTTSTGGVCQ